ncbi:MAG: hypothetical protein R3D82_11940 [Xanthobacteraceae bacterium]
MQVTQGNDIATDSAQGCDILARCAIVAGRCRFHSESVRFAAVASLLRVPMLQRGLFFDAPVL